MNSSRSSYRLKDIIDLDENKMIWTERAKNHIIDKNNNKVMFFDFIDSNSTVLAPKVNINLKKIEKDSFS